MAMCDCKICNAVELNGRMDEEDDTRTENARDRTVSDAWVSRSPIVSSSRIIHFGDFLGSL